MQNKPSECKLQKVCLFLPPSFIIFVETLQQFFECNFFAVIKANGSTIHKSKFLQHCLHSKIISVCIYFHTLYAICSAQLFCKRKKLSRESFPFFLIFNNHPMDNCIWLFAQSFSLQIRITRFAIKGNTRISYNRSI